MFSHSHQVAFALPKTWVRCTIHTELGCLHHAVWPFNLTVTPKPGKYRGISRSIYGTSKEQN